MSDDNETGKNILRMLWKIPPSQSKNEERTSGRIESDFWQDFGDFLTNNSDGVFVTLAQNVSLSEVREGDIIVFDKNIPPETDDLVVIEENGEWSFTEYEEGQEAFAVVIFIGKLTDAHRRQREK